MRTLLCFLIALLLAASAFGRDIYVNNQLGNDTLTGRAPRTEGRQTGPVRTLAKAMRLAQPGDRIVIVETGVPFTEPLSIQGGPRSGFGPEAPLIIEGNGAVIDGLIDIPEDAWEPVGGDVFRYASDVKSHQVLFLGDERAVRVPTKPGDKLPKLEPLQWCLFADAIHFRTEPGRIPQSYYPRCAGSWTGVTIYDVHDVVIRNLVVRGFAFDGVNAHDNAFNVRLEDVTSEDNGRSGFSIGGASKVRLERCQAAFNQTAQVRTEGYSLAVLAECQLDESAAPAIAQDGGELVQE